MESSLPLRCRFLTRCLGLRSDRFFYSKSLAFLDAQNVVWQDVDAFRLDFRCDGSDIYKMLFRVVHTGDQR